MEENNQNINPNTQEPPQAPVAEAPAIQTPPVSTPINPPAGGPKPKFPLAAIIGIVLFLLIAGSAAGFYVFKQQSLKTAIKPTPIPIVQQQIPTQTPIPNPTTSWKTYIGKGYEFRYPNEATIESNTNGSTQTTVNLALKNRSITFEDLISDDSVAPFRESTTSKEINGLSWKEDLTTDEYCDGGECGNTNMSYYLYKNGNMYSFYFKDKQTLSTIIQILSTFKFTDSNVTLTPTCMPRPACLDATPRCMIAEPANGWCP